MLNTVSLSWNAKLAPSKTHHKENYITDDHDGILDQGTDTRLVKQ